MSDEDKELVAMLERIEAEMDRLAPLNPNLTASQLRRLAADSLQAERIKPQ